jgi:uncharacterized repeat protein (TIGR04138 family)
MDPTQNRVRTIESIVEDDPRYRVEAYLFVLDALNYTLRKGGAEGHVTAAELMMGIRTYALEQYGALAKSVLNHWGIRRASEFGDIVFNLIDAEVLGKRPDDKREDFDKASFDMDSELVDRAL